MVETLNVSGVLRQTNQREAQSVDVRAMRPTEPAGAGPAELETD
jgi:hypothetical protein